MKTHRVRKWMKRRGWKVVAERMFEVIWSVHAKYIAFSTVCPVILTESWLIFREKLGEPQDPGMRSEPGAPSVSL